MTKLPLTKRHWDKLAQLGLEALPMDPMTAQLFAPGEAVLRQGLPLDFLAIVMRGKAKVCSTAPSGKHLILSYYQSGGMVGDIEFMAGLPLANATLIAMSQFEIIRIPCDQYGPALKANARFMNALGSELAVKFLRCSNNFVAASLNSSRERLCAYILREARGDLFDQVLTQAASNLGMSYRHLLRLISALCREQVLAKQDGGYRILDREALKARALYDDWGGDGE